MQNEFSYRRFYFNLNAAYQTKHDGFYRNKAYKIIQNKTQTIFYGRIMYGIKKIKTSLIA